MKIRGTTFFKRKKNHIQLSRKFIVNSSHTPIWIFPPLLPICVHSTQKVDHHQQYYNDRMMNQDFHQFAKLDHNIIMNGGRPGLSNFANFQNPSVLNYDIEQRAARSQKKISFHYCSIWTPHSIIYIFFKKMQPG